MCITRQDELAAWSVKPSTDGTKGARRARVLTVATDQHTKAELAACSPDVLFPNLSAVEAALDVLTAD